MIPVMGSLVAQEMVARMLAAKSGRAARRASFIACGIYLAVGSIPVLLGLIGPHVLSLQGESEQFLIHLAREKLPAFAFVAFTGALLATLLSTIDSILLGVGGLIAHNVAIPALNIQSKKAKLRMNRAVVLIAGTACYVMAVRSTSIYDLLESASSFGTAGILVITLFGLWLPRGGTVAALATLVTGVVFTPVAEYVLKLPAPFIATVGACAIVYLACALLLERGGTRGSPAPAASRG
jgi:Na+/proline symporter